MVEIDDNSQNANIIASYNRQNGPPSFVTEPVKVGTDAFHSVKSIGRNAEKTSNEFSKTISLFMRPFCGKNRNISGIVTDVIEQLKVNATIFFTEINNKFESFGAASWQEASKSPENMISFAQNNDLLDIGIENVLWEKVISAWNATFTPPAKLTSISSLKVNDKTTLVKL